jgi:hypothetical protein
LPEGGGLALTGIRQHRNDARPVTRNRNETIGAQFHRDRRAAGNAAFSLRFEQCPNADSGYIVASQRGPLKEDSMEEFIHRENLALLRKRLAEVEDEASRKDKLPSRDHR